VTSLARRRVLDELLVERYGRPGDEDVDDILERLERFERPGARSEVRIRQGYALEAAAARARRARHPIDTPDAQRIRRAALLEAATTCTHYTEG